MAGFLSNVETSVTTGFAAAANAFGAGLLGTFRPAFVVGFAIWITLIAYETAFGKSEDGFTYIFTKIGKIFLIGVIALWGWPDLADLLGGIKDGFVGGGTMANTLETNLIDPITALWERLFAWFTGAVADVGWSEVGRMLSTVSLFILLFVSYLALSIAVALFGVIALAMFLVANSVFTLLLAVGPFFLLCLAFPFTQRFFETFIGNVMTAILGMAFTVLMVLFVASLFGLTNIQNVVPVATDEATVTSQIKSLAVLFASKAALSLLLIYLYFKVFDLAAALGGGLNMGNNMVGGVRGILRDLQRGAIARNSSSVNQISQGGAAGGAPRASAVQRAGRANSSFTGMAMSAAGAGVASGARLGSAAASGGARLGSAAAAGGARLGAAGLAGGARLGMAGAMLAGRAASRLGAYAYNRYSQLTGRGSGR